MALSLSDLAIINATLDGDLGFLKRKLLLPPAATIIFVLTRNPSLLLTDN
jgi:hypothetical protein